MLNDFRLSVEGEKLLKKLEGFRAKPYKDSAGKWTVGYGHVLVPGDGVAGPGDIISESKATSLLEQDVEKTVKAVNSLVINTKINQNQFDAMVIFTYNVGIGAFSKSTILKSVNAGNYEEASKTFQLWCKVHTPQGMFVEIAGLRNRRLAEEKLFDTPVTTVQNQPSTQAVATA